VSDDIGHIFNASMRQIIGLLETQTEMLHHLTHLATPTDDDTNGVRELLLRLVHQVTEQGVMLRRMGPGPSAVREGDARCGCSVADRCPLGRIGMREQCSARELRAALLGGAA
jgi:hypothetical protein